MKTFLCWGISKLEGLFGLLIWPAMFIIGDKEQLIFNQQGQLNADGWILFLTAIIGAAIPAIFTAIYAIKHFDEVTSYSMLFHLSRSSMLDSKIKYFFPHFICCRTQLGFSSFYCRTFLYINLLWSKIKN